MEIDDRFASATPEGVSLEFVLAGLGSRFAALFVDLVIESVSAGIVMAALSASIGFSTSTRGYVTDGAVGLTGFLALFGYHVLFETLNHGRTPGKALVGLRVVRADGGAEGLRSSVLRNVARLVDWLPGLFLLGAVLILASRNNQRLGDLLGGTLVVRDRTAAQRATTGRPWTDGAQWGQWGPAGYAAASPDAPWAVPRPPLPPELAHWDVTRVGPSEIAVVNRFLTARHRYTPESRARLATDLAARLWPLVAGPTTSMHPEHFLEAVSIVKAARG